MKPWSIAILSLLALLTAMTVGYWLPDGIAMLTDRQVGNQDWKYQISGFELSDPSAFSPGSLPLSQKLELIHTAPFSLATLTNGQLMDMSEANEITINILLSLVDIEPWVNGVYVQPCVAYFSENQSFILWAAYVEFHDYCVMQLLLDDATGAVLALQLSGQDVFFEELMPDLFLEQPQDPEQATSPTERLAERFTKILSQYGGITVSDYDPKTAVLALTADDIPVKTELIVSITNSVICYNAPYAGNQGEPLQGFGGFFFP